MFEVWKNIPGYKGQYQASDMSQIRSLNRYARNGQKIPGKILKQGLTPKGYRRVCFSNGAGTQQCKHVHVLVMLTFVGPCPAGKEILHGDGNKSNNGLDNLRYGTRQENVQDAFRLGEIKGMKPVRRSDGVEFPGLRQAARAVSGHSSGVRRSARLNKPYLGFKYEYI